MPWGVVAVAVGAAIAFAARQESGRAAPSAPAELAPRSVPQAAIGLGSALASEALRDPAQSKSLVGFREEKRVLVYFLKSQKKAKASARR